MWEMGRYRPNRNVRLLALVILLFWVMASYVLVLRHFEVFKLPGERYFGAIDPIQPAGEDNLEPIEIDALSDAMQMRAYQSPSVSASANTGSDRDLTLLVTHDKTVEEVKLAAAGHLATSTFEVDLNDGSVIHYPLDAYRAAFRVRLLDIKSSLRFPVRITVWEGLLGYNLHTTSEPGSDPDDVGLTTTVTRTCPVSFCQAGLTRHRDWPCRRHRCGRV
jgi:hypothetical protein